MIKLTQLQRKSNILEVQPQYKKLSIQFSLGGFSFCISDLNSGKPSALVSYTFDINLPSPELLLERVIQFFSEEKLLHQDFDEVLIIHQNNLSTLVPDSFFDKTKLKAYLDFNIKTLANDLIEYDDLSVIGAKNVYIPFVNINNYLFQNFGEFEFKHHATILIEKLIRISKYDSEKKIFVNVSSKSIDVVVIEGENLLLYNNFSHATKEDFIYYILFVAEQLQLNTNEIQLVFLGEIDIKSENYTITLDYFHNISFIEANDDFFNSSDDFLPHSNYILVS